MNRKLGASIAAVALTTTLVACGNDESGNNVEEVQVTETNITTETATDGSADADKSTEADSDADADGETAELTTQDGEKVLVPAAAAKAADEVGMDNWGDPFNVESREDGTTLIEYDADKNIVYSKKTGAVPIVGEISNTWKAEGGLDAEVGLPTEPEEVREDGNGWIQNFENGTIEWLSENGEFTAKIN